jgi:hypothetical protein
VLYEVIAMSLDDVLIATTVSGMFLAVAYIGLGFRESLRLQNLELHRREQAGKLQRATGKGNDVEIAPPGR